MPLCSCIYVVGTLTRLSQANLKDPENDTQMYVVYTNPTEDDILLRDELDAWAEKYQDRVKLLRNWMHLLFLRAIGMTMSMRAGIAADSAAALLFRILSQPALLFSPFTQVEGVEEQQDSPAAYGLIPLSSSIVDLPKIIVAAPLQPPILSWNLYVPLLKVLEYLPRGSPSEACLMKIFVATVEAILQRTFPTESLYEQTRKQKYVLVLRHD
ncbi:GIGANTEA-like protein [Tanacetum coccineum]